MSTNPHESTIRPRCVKITNHILDFGKKYVKHQTLMNFVYRFFQPRITNIILREATDKDIKDVIMYVKNEIDELYKEVDIVEQLKESESLNDPAITNAIKKMPNYKKILEAWN